MAPSFCPAFCIGDESQEPSPSPTEDDENDEDQDPKFEKTCLFGLFQKDDDEMTLDDITQVLGKLRERIEQLENKRRALEERDAKEHHHGNVKRNNIRH